MWVFIFRCAHTFFIIWSNIIRSSKSWTVFSLELTGHHRRIFCLNSRCLTSREMSKTKKATTLRDTLYKHKRNSTYLLFCFDNTLELNKHNTNSWHHLVKRLFDIIIQENKLGLGCANLRSSSDYAILTGNLKGLKVRSLHGTNLLVILAYKFVKQDFFLWWMVKKQNVLK